MKKTIKKVFLSFLALATITTSASPVMAKKITANIPYSIYESKESEHISSGVIHESIQKFSYLGWWNINVLRIDLKDEYTELKGLINPDGIPNRNKVSTLVDKHDAVAGINGDYFNYSPLPSAMGTLINDGEVISSPVEFAYKLPSFYLTDSNKGNVGYIDRNMVATNLRTNKAVIINTINKVTPEFDTVGLLNKHWGKSSIGNKFHNDLIEIIVENNIVTDVRVGQVPVDIPADDGYVLMLRGKNRDRLEGFQVGDEIDLKVATTPDVEGIKFAIGGGSIILKNGELSLTDITDSGNHPRTGIGVNKENTELILVTIDGRDSSFKGVSQAMFGAIMRDLGAYNALNLDGGGSTSMAIKPAGSDKSSLVNKPSDGGERGVVNAVGVMSNAPKGELSYIKVSTDDSNMFIDTTRSFQIKGYDQYHNPVEVDNSLTVYTVDGVEGEVTGNKFKATSKGTATITANYNGIEADTKVKVLGTVMDITTNAKSNKINIDKNSEYKLPDFTGKDIDGIGAKIYNEDINYTITGDIGTIEGNTFYSSDISAGGAISAKLGEGVENILVSVGSVRKVVESFENLNNYNFSSWPKETVSGSLSLSDEARDGSHSISLNYDFTQGIDTRVGYLNLYSNNKLGVELPDYPNKLGLWVRGDNSDGLLKAAIRDGKGKEHLIDLSKAIDWTDWKYINTDLPDNISYPVSVERIYIAEVDSSKQNKGSILIDGLTAYYDSSVGNLVLPTPTTLTDNKNKANQVKEGGFTVAITNEPKGLDELVGYNASGMIRSRLGKSKISVLLNGASDSFKSGLTNYAYIDTLPAYKVNKHGDLVFINIDSRKGGIRPTNADQWMSLNKDLKDRTETNIMIFLPTPIFGSDGFADKMEADLLHKTLREAKEAGKNIFVVHGGNSTKSDLKDGIRYIQLNTKTITSPDNIYDLSIIEFIINEDDVTYQINPIFKRPTAKASN